MFESRKEVKKWFCQEGGKESRWRLVTFSFYTAIY